MHFIPKFILLMLYPKHSYNYHPNHKIMDKEEHKLTKIKQYMVLFIMPQM